MSDIDDITIQRNYDWTRTLTVTYPDGHASEGDAIDLTGATILAKIKRRHDDPDPALIELTVGDGVTLLAQSGTTLGQATLFIAGADSQTYLSAANHVISVYVTPSGGTIQTVIDRQKLPVVDGP